MGIVKNYPNFMTTQLKLFTQIFNTHNAYRQTTKRSHMFKRGWLQ